MIFLELNRLSPELAISHNLPNMAQILRRPCPVCVHVAFPIVIIHLLMHELIHSRKMYSVPTGHKAVL